MKQEINLKVNGTNYQVYADPWQSLLHVLREEIGLTGAKSGCEAGDCGSCTVIVDGKAINSCLMLALQAQGKEITTIEGLESKEGLHPLQQAFVDHFAVQHALWVRFTVCLKSLDWLSSSTQRKIVPAVRHAIMYVQWVCILMSHLMTRIVLPV